MKLGKFLTGLLGGDPFTRLLRAYGAGSVDHVEVNRVATVRAFGWLWSVDVTFRKVAKEVKR